MMPFRMRIQGRRLTVVVLLLATAVAACLADLSGPTAAAASGQDCSSPVCEHQLVCGQPAQPQGWSGHQIHFVAVSATIEADLAPEMSCERLVLGSPPARLAWHSVAPFAPRSPPVA